MWKSEEVPMSSPTPPVGGLFRPESIKAEIEARARKKKISVSSCARRLICAGLDKRGLSRKEKAALREMLS